MSAPRRLATAALGGLLLALSMPPWPGSTGSWPLGVVGAGVVFAAVDGRRLRTRLGAGLAAGLALYLPGLWWMRDFNVAGFVVTVLLEAAILAGALALVPSSRRRGPGSGVRVAAFPAALVVAEAARGAWPFGGLPLAGIELGQVAGPLAPAARLGGRLLIVALVGLAGAALASAAAAALRSAPPAGGGGRRGEVVAGTGAMVAVVVLAIGGAVAPGGRAAGTVLVAAVQGGGERGFRAVDGDPEEVLQTHLRVGATVGPGIDVVLWPEDVVDVPGVLVGSSEERALAGLATALGTTMVVGVIEDIDEDNFRNAAVVFGPDGRILDRYDKVHRVPFGEYIPARSFFSRLGDVSAVPRDAIAGRGPGVVDVPAPAGRAGGGTLRLGVLISFEVFFPDRGRAAVRAGGGVLLVPTNASSFRDAQVPAHELAAARLRAIESGRWVVQAAPTGYSAVVDHHGRVLARSGLGSPAVLRQEVQVRSGRTPYVALGPAPVLLTAVAVLAAGWTIFRRKKPERGNSKFGDGLN